MANIKFYRDTKLPDSPTAADDGMWFIKADQETKMSIYLIYNGTVVSLDVIDTAALNAALADKADTDKVVKTFDDQTIDDIKTFLKPPQSKQDAVKDQDLVRLSQMNDRFSIFTPPTDGEDGEDGAPGETPYIGANGNWWIGDHDTGTRVVNDYQVAYDDDIMGMRNRDNHKFSIVDAYQPGTLKVYMNGLLLTKGNNQDFVEKTAGSPGNGATINRVISTEDKLIFEYIAK